eukprot:g26394.t1
MSNVNPCPCHAAERKGQPWRIVSGGQKLRSTPCSLVPSGNKQRCEDDGVPSITENRGQCQMCRQMHILVDQGMCEACNLGRRYVFRYECQRCHRLQRIPHPMWRYQATPTDFSSSTWACHQGCGDYTTWRLAPEDVGQVGSLSCTEAPVIDSLERCPTWNVPSPGDAEKNGWSKCDG